MATLIPVDPFRYWLKNTYPQIYDETKSNYDLLFELKTYYLRLRNKTNSIISDIVAANVEKNTNYETFNTWFLNQLETDPYIDSKIEAALKNGTIPTVADNLAELNGLLFTNIY